MKSTADLHRLAMSRCDDALVARSRGDSAQERVCLTQAFKFEQEAAFSLRDMYDMEPSRSVLFRSAASLGRECGLFDEAERLVHAALAGNPPASIKKELRDLLDEVGFQRHLKLDGLKLSQDEVQMAITGNQAGFGVAPTDLIVTKMSTAEILFFRTAERRSDRPYRDRGRRDSTLARDTRLDTSNNPGLACVGCR